jgi:hypothetical protein
MAEPRSASGPGAVGELPGWLAQQPAELAARLTQLAAEPELTAHRSVLSELGDVVDHPHSAEADSWTQLDLLAAFGRAESIGQAAPRRPGLRRFLPIASSGLIFFPVLCTWLGISFAAAAYGRLLASPAGRSVAAGQSFLELWQRGFDGRLTSLLDLTHVALFALAAIVALILVTLANAAVAQADEHAAERRRADIQARLMIALTGAQLALNRRRLDSPGRFAGELSSAAAGLNDLLDRVREAEKSSTAAADNAAGLARSNADAAEQLRASAATLGSATGNLQAMSERLGIAVAGLQVTISQLGGDITGRIADAAAELAAASALAQEALAATQAAGRAALTAAGTQLDAALAGLAERIGQSTDGLAAAGSDFAAKIGASGDQAARDIGITYQEAVAAAAVDLEEKMTEVGGQLAAAAARLSEAVSAAAARWPGPAAANHDADWRRT